MYGNVPKIMHFIWLGGPLRPVQTNRIAHWAQKNPHYRFLLWYDSQQFMAYYLRRKLQKFASNGEDLDGLRELQADAAIGVHARGGHDGARIQYLAQARNKSVAHYQQKRDDFVAKMKGEKDKITGNAAFSNVEFRDIQTLGGDVFTKQSNASLYKQEMIARGSNFGAASDILRIELLIRYGGIYCDVDLECIKPLITFRCQQNLALWGVWKVQLSNALIAACPKSNMMLGCRRHIKANYSKLRLNEEQLQQLYFENVRTSTIRMTGPSGKSGVTQDVRSAAETKARSRFERRSAFDYEKEELWFPEGYINFDTEEQKVHDWLI